MSDLLSGVPPLPAIQVIARPTDPETSHEAAADLEQKQTKLQKSVAAVVLLIKDHGPMTDFRLRELWPTIWVGKWSYTLPCKARHWAREAGLVKHSGFSTHNGRRVRLWDLGRDDGFMLVDRCPCCGKPRTRVSTQEVQNVPGADGEEGGKGMTEPSEEVVVRMGFDPLTCDCEDTRAIFADDTARTLYLLWRRNHITSQRFARQCRAVAAMIADRMPQTADELRKCFPWSDVGDFTRPDMDQFCPEAIPFFRGEKRIGFRLMSERPKP